MGNVECCVMAKVGATVEEEENALPMVAAEAIGD